MFNCKLFSVTFLLHACFFVSGQSSSITYLNLDWVIESDFPDTIQWSDSEVDGSGNTYFIGNTYDTATSADILIKKINSQGVLDW